MGPRCVSVQPGEQYRVLNSRSSSERACVSIEVLEAGQAAEHLAVRLGIFTLAAVLGIGEIGTRGGAEKVEILALRILKTLFW